MITDEICIMLAGAVSEENGAKIMKLIERDYVTRYGTLTLPLGPERSMPYELDPSFMKSMMEYAMYRADDLGADIEKEKFEIVKSSGWVYATWRMKRRDS